MNSMRITSNSNFISDWHYFYLGLIKVQNKSLYRGSMSKIHLDYSISMRTFAVDRKFWRWLTSSSHLVLGISYNTKWKWVHIRRICDGRIDNIFCYYKFLRWMTRICIIFGMWSVSTCTKVNIIIVQVLKIPYHYHVLLWRNCGNKNFKMSAIWSFWKSVGYKFQLGTTRDHVVVSWAFHENIMRGLWGLWVSLQMDDDDPWTTRYNRWKKS